MQILEKLKILDKAKSNTTFKILILKCNVTKNSFKGKILGRELCEWVTFAASGHDIDIVDYDGKVNIIEFVKNKLDKRYDYTLVLFSTIPLITSETIKNVKEYSTFKNVNLCKLPVGYVIRNSSTLDKPFVDSVYSQDLDDFYLVENKKQFTYALSVLQDRINNYHISNGVEIIDSKKVYIEPFVDIAGDVIIYPGNSLKGSTIISEKVILKENNVISNSKINKECCISGSVITDSIIGKCSCISPFCELENALVGNDVIIGKGCVIKKYKIDDKDTIKPNSVLGDT